MTVFQKIAWGAVIAVVLATGWAGPALAGDALFWRSSKKVGQECFAVCEKQNFADDVLTDSCKSQCEKAVKVYKKWRSQPCTDKARAGCFGDVMSKSIGMLPAEHQAWVTVANYGCKNK